MNDGVKQPWLVVAREQGTGVALGGERWFADAEVCALAGVDGYVLLHMQGWYFSASLGAVGDGDFLFLKQDGSVSYYRWHGYRVTESQVV